MSHLRIAIYVQIPIIAIIITLNKDFDEVHPKYPKIKTTIK